MTLKFTLVISISILYLSISYTSYCQTDSSFLSHAANLLENQPATEKVYLHLDKQDYNFGDTIWYKAYTVIGHHHQLSALSGVLHVELISPKDSLVTRQILPLVSGVGWSEIPLPHTLKQGAYRIRAYTNWMRNAGPDYFYDHRIMIGGLPAELNTRKQTVQVKPDIQFFPEGGELVNGVRSRVAFKAANSKGLGENINGTIIDNEGNVVADIASQHLGMGVFALMPQSGKTYTAMISGTGGAAFTVDLPKALEEGYTLAVNNRLSDSVNIKVTVNEKTLIEQKNSVFYIIVQSGGKVYFTSEGKLEGLAYSAKVEKSRFPSGIAQFTLFSQMGEPLAERIAFIQNNDTLKLNLAAPASSSATRQAVKISLAAKGSNNSPIEGSFSAAVINESVNGTDEENESTIFNNLLLTSELKGYVEQPNYYFTNVNEQTKTDLDVLMLTQGYRRFEWKQLLNNTTSSITYQPERSLEITGALKTPSGKPVLNGKITLIATKENLLKDTSTDINGNFKFTNLFLMDTTNIVLKARKENKSDNVKIALSQPGYPAIAPASDPGCDVALLPAPVAAIIQKQYIIYQQAQKQDFLKNGILLKQVNIHGYKQPPTRVISNSSNLHGGGSADQVIMGDQLGGCIALSNCLVGKIFGVNFSENGSPLNTRGGSMSVIVDGAVLTHDHLNDINTEEIYSIEVLRSSFAKAIYGSSIESGGALVITLKRGNEGTQNFNNVTSPEITTFPFIGFYKARAFYSPKYTGPKNDKQQADERSTIYWNPNILTGKDGKVSFEYFNNDTKGTYRVVVEGIDDNGNLGRLVYRYNVE